MAGAAVLNGQVYIIGGHRSDVVLKDGARSTNGGWELIAPMSCPRDGCGVAALGGFVYAVGGQSTTNGFTNGGVSYYTVERYNPTTNSWSAVADLSPTGRSHLCLVALNGKLYALGGRKGDGSDLSDVERYDPALNTWTTVAHMLQPRACAAAVVIGNHIYVVGGDREGGTYESGIAAERYDPASDTWEAVAGDDEVLYRSHHAAVAV